METSSSPRTPLYAMKNLKLVIPFSTILFIYPGVSEFQLVIAA
jgi:hypothetical protein